MQVFTFIRYGQHLKKNWHEQASAMHVIHNLLKFILPVGLQLVNVIIVSYMLTDVQYAHTLLHTINTVVGRLCVIR